MNEELTREVLEAMAGCKHDCTPCCANEACGNYDWQDTIQILATALLEERARPRDDVWDGAPEWATVGRVYWTNKEHGVGYSKLYRRELPKTRARQIAEKEGRGLAGQYGWSVAAEALVTNRIESALTKYAEELTDTKETN